MHDLKGYLIDEATEARKEAYAPYSQFAVGAALFTKCNKVIRGCNIENASSSVTICAERTAVYKAISEGFKDFVALAVVAATKEPCRPCGSCRQVFVEFNPEMEIIMGNLNGEIECLKARELLPIYFK